MFVIFSTRNQNSLVGYVLSAFLGGELVKTGFYHTVLVAPVLGSTYYLVVLVNLVLCFCTKGFLVTFKHLCVYDCHYFYTLAIKQLDNMFNIALNI